MNVEFGRIWKDIVVPPCLKDCSNTCLGISKRSTRNMDSSVSTVTRLRSGDRKTGSQFSLSRRKNFCICHRVEADPEARSGSHLEGTETSSPE